MRILPVVCAFLCERNHYLYYDDEEDDQALLYMHNNSRRRRREFINYVQHDFAGMRDLEFKSHFRLHRDTFETLLNEVGGALKRKVVFGNQMVSAERQLLMTLWRLGTPDSYRSIHTSSGVGKVTAVRCVRRTTTAICSLASRFILWPDEERQQQIARGFSRNSAFPNVIGAIDGSHIQITAPEGPHSECYINRKGKHSMQLQAVCDHQLIFTHISVGDVGCMHDARVYRRSAVHDYVHSDGKFQGDTHIIGDAAYPLNKRLMVGYRDNGRLTRRQKNFNFCLSSARMAIERAFGTLKNRWRSILDTLKMSKTENILSHIMACCVLHNICIMNRDIWIERPRPEEHMPIVIPPPERERAEAEAKRNLICATLRMRHL